MPFIFYSAPLIFPPSQHPISSLVPFLHLLALCLVLYSLCYPSLLCGGCHLLCCCAVSSASLWSMLLYAYVISLLMLPNDSKFSSVWPLFLSNIPGDPVLCVVVNLLWCRVIVCVSNILHAGMVRRYNGYCHKYISDAQAEIPHTYFCSFQEEL